MRRLARAAMIAGLAGLMLAGPAVAAKRIYSYDSANPLTEQMTESGLTFIFDRTFMSTRVERILETHDVGAADVKPASEGELGPGGLTALIGDAPERSLYEIVPKGDGRALIRALCPGADRVFLAFGPITAEQPLRIRALGHDPFGFRTQSGFLQHELEADTGPFGTAQEANEVRDRLAVWFPVTWVGRTFEEIDARLRRKAPDVIHGKN